MGFFDFASVKRSVQSLEERLGALKKDINELKRKRTLVEAAPVAKEDVKALLSKWVNESGDAYVGALATSVADIARTTSAFTNQSRLKQLASFGALGYSDGIKPDHQALGQSLCAVFGGVISETLNKVVDAMEWPEGALTARQRNEAVEGFNDQIFKLETEAQDIINKASELGIHLG
ncbi:MAG: hypothetical protein Q7V09_20790 [Hydrogenophaga sp.]|uniref:hypothetical protein n=1 Tax=Hydrogenophaga sp. TaxID=1904254 RepID=UPI00271EF5F1|nr:hypothetical protein [Hydrogenophaga sp.]MDO9032872.1 hypothetical protein [Hydrogenophaga sp.]